MSYCSSVDLLFLFNSSMHQSRCSISSCCCLLSSTTILSISSLTLVNASNWARLASKDNSGAPVCTAARSRTEVARRRRSLWPLVKDSWSSATLTVLSKFSNDSSSFRILMVSSTAAISSNRSFTRWSNSPALMEHFSFKLAKKVLSSSSCALVSSSSLNACASFVFTSAICSSSSSLSARPAEISSTLDACNALKSATSCFSLAFRALRSFSKSSFI
mmetsp:Transcript_53590/g.135342  ORF Transcript_53590/g.135342 Transcript_53590/m.135342 type:complete len:218 (-) Transcript_53590:767-1420(-)